MDEIQQITEDQFNNQDQMQLIDSNQKEEIVSSSPLIQSEKINSEKVETEEFQLNIQMSESSDEKSSPQNQDKFKKKRRNTINLMSSDDDLNINFEDGSEVKLQSENEQFILKGLSSSEIGKSDQNSGQSSKEGSVERKKNQQQLIGENNFLLEDDEILQKRMDLSSSSDEIDEQRLQMMRRELQYQLFDNKYSTLFTRQRGKLSVDIKDLDETEDQDQDDEEDDDDFDDSYLDNKKKKVQKINNWEFNDEKDAICNWGDLQNFISSTGTYLLNEKKQIQKLLQKLENCYKDSILSNLAFREQFSRRKDYSLESKQYVPIVLDSKYQVFRVDNALKVNLSIAKDYICDILKYIQLNPTLLAQVISSLSTYRDLEINDFIENVNNFFFDNIFDSTPTSKPLFKFLAEILKKEINNAKKVQDTFKMDSIYMKFIQGFTKRTNFQIFFSDSFKIPLYSIIKLNKIIKIDPTKITNEDINLKRHHLHHSNQNQNAHSHHNSSGHFQMNSSLNGSSGADFRHTQDSVLRINVSQDNDNRAPQSNRNTTGFFNTFFSLFTSADSKKKRKDSSITMNDSILQAPQLNFQNSSSSCNNVDSIEESSLNINSNDSYMNSQPKSVENSVIDEVEEDRAAIEDRKMKEVENNINILKQITTQIIDSLTKHVSCIPKGIKIMCKMIVILLGEKDPTLNLQDRLQVLSQFLIMRWVVPSLVALLHKNTLTELHQLRYQNISIVTKVLQKIFKKEHDNLNDYPGLDKLKSFIQGFSERIDQFYDYLLNFDGGFIQEIINKPDIQLCILKEDAITCLCVSFNDVDLILKIFSSVQDDKIKSEHKKLFTQVEKCIRINDQEKYLDSSIKSQQNTLFYIWRPAEYYTSNLVEKCFKFQITNKNDKDHVNKQKLINTLIQFFQKVNPGEDFIENKSLYELQGILNFYGRKNKMSQKIMQNGLQVKIQSNFIKNLLKRMSPDYDCCTFSHLLSEIQSEVKARKGQVIDQIKYIKYKIQLAISKLHSQTMKIKKENLDMLERTIKQNILLFIKKGEVPVRVIYQEDCQIMIEKEQDENQFRDTYSLYRESIQTGFDQVKQKIKKKQINLNENDMLCKNVKEFIECMQQKRIFDKLIDYNPQNIKVFRKQINNYNDFIVEKFFNLPKMQTCNRMAIYEQVQIQFEKYLARALAKKYLIKKEQYSILNSPKSTGNRKISLIDRIKSNSKKSYDDAHLAQLCPKLEKIQKQTNHIDILYIIDECVDQLRDLAELNGQNKNEELVIVSKMVNLIEKSQIQECQTIIKIIDSLMNYNFWIKKVKIIQSLTIFKLAANEIAAI